MHEWEQAKLSTDPVELDRFSRHDNWLVRSHAAENENTSIETLTKLADDPSADVRIHVAKNKKTPLVALVKLLNDPSGGVCGRAKKNLEERSILDELLTDE